MISLLLHGWSQCPDCEHGALKTPDDYKRGHCDACYMLKHDGLKIERQKHQAVLAKFRAAFPWVADFRAEYPRAFGERPTFRSEAIAYDDDIYDRD